jgi:hypothetical protein
MSDVAKIIKIVSCDKIEAPNWVKDAWKGCIMPGIEHSQLPKNYPDILINPKDYFFVRQDIALMVLRKKLPAAALWYSNFGHPKPGTYFIFPTNEVVEIGIQLPSLKPGN